MGTWIANTLQVVINDGFNLFVHQVVADPVPQVAVVVPGQRSTPRYKYKTAT